MRSRQRLRRIRGPLATASAARAARSFRVSPATTSAYEWSTSSRMRASGRSLSRSTRFQCFPLRYGTGRDALVVLPQEQRAFWIAFQSHAARQALQIRDGEHLAADLEDEGVGAEGQVFGRAMLREAVVTQGIEVHGTGDWGLGTGDWGLGDWGLEVSRNGPLAPEATPLLPLGEVPALGRRKAVFSTAPAPPEASGGVGRTPQFSSPVAQSSSPSTSKPRIFETAGTPKSVRVRPSCGLSISLRRTRPRSAEVSALASRLSRGSVARARR